MEHTAKHQSVYKASSANPEFLFVLHKIVMALRQAMQHDKLPDLTPEQMSDWFKSIEPEHISCVIEVLKDGTREHETLMRAWAKIAEGDPCKPNAYDPTYGILPKNKDGKMTD
jgi:hypothetical protein